MFKATNIEEQLQKERSKQQKERDILVEVLNILRRETTQTDRITVALKAKHPSPTPDFTIDLLETDRIYHLTQIKKICIAYRLRFLDSGYFKGKIPAAARSKIRQLEAKHGTALSNFKIMVPSRLFKLADKNDPLLFVSLGHDYYYLIHKWGNDLHPLRKALIWPFKSIEHLTFCILFLSYVVTLMVPEGLFSKNSSPATFWMLYFFMFKSIAAAVIFYGFALGKNFNRAIWNSKYFNS